MEKIYEFIVLVPEHIGWMIVGAMMMIYIRALVKLIYFIYKTLKENREGDEEI